MEGGPWRSRSARNSTRFRRETAQKHHEFSLYEFIDAYHKEPSKWFHAMMTAQLQ